MQLLICETFKEHSGKKQAHYMKPNKEYHDLNPTTLELHGIAF